MNRITSTLTLLLLLVTVTLSAQKPRQSFEGYIEAADRAEDRDDHYNAYRLYAIAAEDEWSDDAAYRDRIGEVYYKAGTAAYRATAYGQAERFLALLQNEPAVDRYPLTKYYLGQSVFRQGRYDQAVAYFESFLDEQPRAPENYRSTARAQINDADWAIDKLSRAEDITLNHLPEGVNTAESDISYVRGPKGNRYFSSNRFEWKKDSIRPHRTLSRIMRQTGVESAVPLPETINLPGKNVGHAAFNANMTRVYYSVCDFRNYDELICDVYQADVSPEGKWVNPQKTKINQEGYSTTQPNVGFDPSTGEEYLFFASDRPGGQGGLDLYRAPLAADGGLGTAQNIARLNTQGDEASPFWYGPRKTLYFSSNGLNTLGGMDVYKAYLVDGRFRRPNNLGAPINSSADEAYYTRFDDPSVAYVSSRRPSEEAIFYSDARDVCCYDIYEFTPDPRLDLLVTTFNGLTEEDLIGATVKLYKVGPDGPELTDEFINLTDNEFYFKVEEGMKYQLVAEKDGFISGQDEFDLSTPELKDLSFIERRIDLRPKVDLDVFTFNNVDEQILNGTTIQLYEVADDGSLTLVNEITDENGNEAHFELEIGKKYQVTGTKPGFGRAAEEIDLTGYDPNKGGATMRRDLYLGQFLEVYVIDGLTDEPLDNATLRLARADGSLVSEDTNPDGNDFYYTVNLDQPFILNTQRVNYFSRTDTLRFSRQDLIDGDGKLVYYVPLFSSDLNDFLPFEVYFDNDHPNPDSYSSATDLTYPETYGPYLDRRPEFLDQATEGLSEEDAFLTRGDINQFFEQEVIAGNRQLLRFADALLLHLSNGGSFVVELQGYASPRAPEEYNRRLSARRNMSVMNFFRTHLDGRFVPYIEGGELEFTEAALGETTANLEQIYERIDRERESIYSTIASLERRVTMRNYEKTDSRKKKKK